MADTGNNTGESQKGKEQTQRPTRVTCVHALDTHTGLGQQELPRLQRGPWMGHRKHEGTLGMESLYTQHVVITCLCAHFLTWWL